MPKFETCEWCAEPATYRVWAKWGSYIRYSCGRHSSKLARLADLDLGPDSKQSHSVSSVPFPAEQTEVKD